MVPRLNITGAENKLFSILLETLDHFKLHNTSIRVAGGWVRDRILGKDTEDIDVVLNNFTGKAFAEYVNDYLKLKGYPTHRIGVIVANPEQSKHLETAKVKIFDHEVDFVNLRSETYEAEASHRIPTVRFGTAREDAERRDFTINSLFYNVNTQEVEDLTGKGLDDLRSKLIRTPLNPLETFRDDPLRILRAVRFSSRLGFAVVPDIIEAARNPQTKEALGHKVSRERIGVEVEKMLKSHRPLDALHLLKELHVADIVFRVPRDFLEGPINEDSHQITWIANGFEEDSAWIEDSLKNVRNLFVLCNLMRESESLCVSDFIIARINQIDPLVKCFAPVLYKLHGRQIRNFKGKIEAAETIVLRDALKVKNLISNQVLTANIAANEFVQVQQLLEKDPSAHQLKQKLGRLIRASKELWVLGLLIQTCSVLSLEFCECTKLSQVSPSDQAEILKLTSTFKEINDMGLLRFYETKPLLNGKEMMKLKNLKKGGPILGALLEAMWDWQALNPSGNKTDCEAFMKELAIETLSG